MRELDWGGAPNIRDLGGLAGRWGETRYGRVARGPRRELIPEQGWRAARDWGLRTVVDLRCPEEQGRRDGDPRVEEETLRDVVIRCAPTEDHDNAEFRETCFPILDSPEYWPHNLRILPGLVAAALTTLAAAEPGIFVHCSAGRDRTGMVTAILLANAGVAPGVVADDYAQSVRAMAGVASHAPTHDRQAAWSDEQVKAWLHRTRPLVERFASGIPAHLEMIGLPEITRNRLRELLLDA